MPYKVILKELNKKLENVYFSKKSEIIPVNMKTNAFTSKVLINAFKSNFESTQQKSWKRSFF